MGSRLGGNSVNSPASLEASIETVAGLLLSGLALYTIGELVVVHFAKRALRWPETRMSLFGMLSQGLAGGIFARLSGPLTVAIAASTGHKIAAFQTGLDWPWWIYGLVVYEWFYWVQHWAAHKVRLLWCIHSPHHAPGGIHMAIGANHSFLETLFYFPLFLGFLPAVCGVDPIIVVAINLADVIWGSFLHISDQIVPRGRYGAVGRVLQTPAHHRVHHAQNIRYRDTNYNSITLLWDWLFGTLQPLQDDEPVVYGITRELDTGSFWDVHFGEFRALYADLRRASGPGEVLRYLFCAPGWKPGDASETVSALKAR